MHLRVWFLGLGLLTGTVTATVLAILDKPVEAFLLQVGACIGALAGAPRNDPAPVAPVDLGGQGPNVEPAVAPVVLSGPSVAPAIRHVDVGLVADAVAPLRFEPAPPPDLEPTPDPLIDRATLAEFLTAAAVDGVVPSVPLLDDDDELDGHDDPVT